MKKLFLTLVVLAGMMVSTVYAGDFTEIGIKGGLSHSNFSDKDHSFWSAVDGIVGGAYVTYSFSDTVGIQLEGLYSMRGSQGNQSEVDGTIYLDYIEVNLLGVLQARTFPHTKLLLGPGIGLFSSGSLKYQATINQTQVSGSQPIHSSDVNSPQYSVILGVEYKINHITLGVRNAWGLNRVFNKDYWDYTVKNTGLQVMAGVYF